MASQNYSEMNPAPTGKQGTRDPAGKPVDVRESGRDDADAELDATAAQARDATGQDPRDGVPGVGRGLDEDTGTDTISGFGIGADDQRQ